MIRSLVFFLAAGLVLPTALISAAAQSCRTSGASENCRAGGAAESIPDVHHQPIAIRILGGKDGLPLAHLHLILIAGYDQNEIHDQLFREEALTDAQGRARLSSQLANLPWLQVWVSKKPLCQIHPRTASFSVGRIRRDGLSAPNLCGTATVEDAPGVFTVFVKGKGQAPVASPDPCASDGGKKASRSGSACEDVGRASTARLNPRG